MQRYGIQPADPSTMDKARDFQKAEIVINTDLLFKVRIFTRLGEPFPVHALHFAYQGANGPATVRAGGGNRLLNS